MYFFCCKAQQRLKELCIIKQQSQEWPQKSHEQDIKQIKNKIDQSVFVFYTGHELFFVFGFFYASGAQDTEVTKSLLFCPLYNDLIEKRNQNGTKFWLQKQKLAFVPNCKVRKILCFE